MSMDRITTIAYALSSLVHLGLVVVALWRLTATPPEQMPPDDVAPPAAEARPTEALQAVPDRMTTQLGKLEQIAEDLPPLAWQELPELSTELPRPRDYHSLEDETSRGSGDQSLGLELQLSQSRIDPTPGLLDSLAPQAMVADEEVDRWTQEWQRTAFQFALVNEIRQAWRQRWKPAFGERGPKTTIRIDLSVSPDGSVRYHGLVPGHGTGIDALDQRIDNYLRRRPPTTVQPTTELAGRLPFVVLLD